MSLYAPPSAGLVARPRRRRPPVLDAGRAALIPLRPLTIGEILDAGFTVLRANARTMMGMPLALAGVATVYVLVVVGGLVALGDAGVIAQTVVGFLAGLVGILLLALCLAWMTAVLTRASLHTLLGDGFAPDSRIGWRDARAMFWPMVGLSLLVAVVTGVVNTVTSVLYYLSLIPVVLSGGSEDSLLFSTVVAIVLFIVLYSATYSYIALVVPAWTVENQRMPGWIGKPATTTNIATAFVRSVVLIGLRNLPRATAVMAAVLVITVLVAAVLYVGLGLVLLIYSQAVGLDLTSRLTDSPWVLAVSYALVVVITASAQIAFVASVQTVLYLDLRMRREGLDLALRFDEVDVPQPSAPPVLARWAVPQRPPGPPLPPVGPRR